MRSRMDGTDGREGKDGREGTVKPIVLSVGECRVKASRSVVVVGIRPWKRWEGGRRWVIAFFLN